MYTPAHREPLIQLARRALLAPDSLEATPIIDALTHAPVASVLHYEGGRLIGAVLASRGHKDATDAHLDLLLVDPDHRRNGLARRMLTELEDTLRSLGFARVRVSGNAPDYAWPGVDVRYTAAICALQAHGYTHDSAAWNMTVSLPVPAVAERDLPEGVTVRRAGKQDLDTLLPVVSGEWGPAWTAEVERAITGPGGVHLAEREGSPVAFAAWGGCRPSWFGPMGTLPTAAGLGLGGLLLRRCLADQHELGLTEAQIGWVGPVPFYANAAGAFIERVFFLLIKPLT
jgi:mycothiol synthase